MGNRRGSDCVRRRRVLVGLRCTLFGEGGPRMGDVAYHAGGLALLLTTLALLLSPAGRRARSYLRRDAWGVVDGAEPPSRRGLQPTSGTTIGATSPKNRRGVFLGLR